MSTNQEVEPRPMRKLTAATVVGNTIEFYDFNVYGTLTALVFAKIFFSAEDPAVGTLLAFGTFAVGFLSRPLGGIVFGHFGDKFGRKPVLIASLMTMGGATALMGLLPTYAAIGVAAPILLVVLRFVQGFGLGGEWGGAVTLMLESAPVKRRGIFGSLVQTGSGLGIILATAVVTIMVTVLTPAQVEAWGWRIPLLISVVLVAVGLVIRTKVEESPIFAELEKKADVTGTPLLQTLRVHYRMVLLAIGMFIAIAAFGFTQGVFFVSYLVDNVGVPRATATTANLIAAVFYLMSILLGGFLSDKLGRTKTYLIGGALLIPAPFIMFAAGSTGNASIIFPVMALIGAMTGLGYGAQAALFFELFPARVRFTGTSLGFQIAATLGGGFTPLLAAALTQATGSTIAVSVYIAVLALLMIGCTAIAPRVLRSETAREERDGHAVDVEPRGENS